MLFEQAKAAGRFFKVLQAGGSCGRLVGNQLLYFIIMFLSVSTNQKPLIFKVYFSSHKYTYQVINLIDYLMSFYQ